MTTINYSYANGDLLENPQNYSYSGYYAEAFIDSWKKHRESQLTHLPKATTITQLNGKTLDCGDVNSLLHAICESLQQHSGLAKDPAIAWLKRLVKKFEVTKRVYTSYQQVPPHRPMPDGCYTDLTLYIKLAECFILAFEQSAELQYLNAFIKLQDSIISQTQKLCETSQANLAWLIQKEITTFTKLINSKGLAWQPR